MEIFLLRRAEVCHFQLMETAHMVKLEQLGANGARVIQ